MKNRHLYRCDDTEILVERHFSDKGCGLDIIKKCLLESVQNIAKYQEIQYSPYCDASVVTNEVDR